MKAIPILHRVSRCPGCGYPGHANEKGRMMCCEIRESDMKSEFKERRCNTRGRRTQRAESCARGDIGPLFAQGMGND